MTRHRPPPIPRAVALSAGLALAFPVGVVGQGPGVRVTGVVVSERGSLPIPGALVALDAGRRTMADSAGAFVLDDVRPGPYRIAAVAPGCHVGLGEVTVSATGTLEVRLAVALPPEAEERLASWSLGARSTGESVRSITGEEIRRRHFRSIPDVLRALAPDMVGGESASAGGRQSLRGRGAPTVGASGDPLVVIDGVRMGQRSMDALASMNANEVERVEVVRGGTGGWRYGIQGANGVIRITTRDATGGHGGDTAPQACAFTFGR